MLFFMAMEGYVGSSRTGFMELAAFNFITTNIINSAFSVIAPGNCG